MRIRSRLVLAGIGLALAVSLGVLAADFFRFLHAPLRPGGGESVVLTIESGSAVRRVASDLEDRGLLDRPLYFRLFARASRAARNIQAGEYAIDPNTTPYRLLEKLVAGDVKVYSLTIIEGWTFAQMRAAIEDHEAIRESLGDMEPAAIMERLGFPDQHPEGRFFPDTYQFPRGTTALEILRRAHERMARVLEDEWAERSEGLPLDSPYEALILASIIERETGVPDERARIAGVFVERLERGMRLQTDPTVIYGLGDEFEGDLRYKHLREDTPYNTYTRAGLPPTPIALPSRPAIHAALHPDRRGELYFVSTGDGRHVFSRTLEEHNEAVVKYQLGGDRSRLRD